MTLLDLLSTRTAVAAVLAAKEIDTAHAVAKEELARLDAIAAGENDLLSVTEAAGIVGKDTSTIRRWCERHQIGRRLGRGWLISRRKFLAYVDGAGR